MLDRIAMRSASSICASFPRRVELVGRSRRATCMVTVEPPLQKATVPARKSSLAARARPRTSTGRHDRRDRGVFRRRGYRKQRKAGRRGRGRLRPRGSRRSPKWCRVAHPRDRGRLPRLAAPAVARCHARLAYAAMSKHNGTEAGDDAKDELHDSSVSVAHARCRQVGGRHRGSAFACRLFQRGAVGREACTGCRGSAATIAAMDCADFSDPAGPVARADSRALCQARNGGVVARRRRSTRCPRARADRTGGEGVDLSYLRRA